MRISAETLYVQAGILEKPDGNTDLARHILADHNLTEEQKPEEPGGGRGEAIGDGARAWICGRVQGEVSGRDLMG